jgi:energy-coupling factor transporter ATP-binding protein EcfA2
MKKITSLQIENYRAFFGRYQPLILPKGENLLVYGENGSGKSSLFKALDNFFTSSRIAGLPFQKNHHSTGLPGELFFTFVDIDAVTKLPLLGTEQSFSFNDTASTNAVNFIQDADLIKGFLHYSNLLAVYNHKDPKPNLFNLIVVELLKDFLPVGSTYRIGEKYLALKDDLLKVRTRRDRKHQAALRELPTFQATLTTTLDRILRRLNFYLIKYFQLNLRIGYILQNIVYDYTWNNWHIVSDLRLDLRLNGITVQDHGDVLNEARLSALAICLYLAALKENPTAIDYKILFLDDVFIGLDASNRIPIANILKNDFTDYQIFITTYDRHWFELAQRYFKSNMPDKWQSYEFYAVKQKNNGITFDAPLVIYQEDNFSKAIHYLHHASKPDYPAAANYFRKYTEELLIKHLPKHETRLSKDDSAIESYKLGLLVSAGLHFLNKIGADTTLMVRLKNSLPTLLHPLSHYELSAPIYKIELLDISNCIQDLEKYLIQLKTNYRLLFTPGRMIKLNFTISATDTGHYEIFTKDAIYILRGTGISLSLSQGHCHCKTSYIVANTVEQPRNKYRNTDKKYQYTSLENGYDLIYAFIITQGAFAHIAKQANYSTEFTLQGAAGISTLEQHMNAFVW